MSNNEFLQMGHCVSRLVPISTLNYFSILLHVILFCKARLFHGAIKNPKSFWPCLSCLAKHGMGITALRLGELSISS